MEEKASVDGLTGTINSMEEALLISAAACLSSGRDIFSGDDAEFHKSTYRTDWLQKGKVWICGKDVVCEGAGRVF